MKYYGIIFQLLVLVSVASTVTSFCSEAVTKDVARRVSRASNGADNPNDVVYEKPKRIATFTHLAAVASVSFNRRCDKIVTVTSDNGLVYLWDIHDSQDPLLVFDHNESNRPNRKKHSKKRSDKFKRPLDAWFSNDGKCIFTTVEGKEKSYCWSTRNGKRRKSFLTDRHEDYSRDGYELRGDGTAVLIVEGTTRKTIQRMSHHESVTSARWNRNGTHVVSSAGNLACLWRVGRTVQEITNQGRNEDILKKAKKRYAVEGLSDILGL